MIPSYAIVIFYKTTSSTKIIRDMPFRYFDPLFSLEIPSAQDLCIEKHVVSPSTGNATVLQLFNEE
ncbi:hypothetical protein AU500_08880 [Lonsdalea populi]|uniref:Uncharacterized protein n=2 Tax=Lonsdalea TaxID=1082702 RepID=A0ACD1JF20_9GAMM|nr:hypothetical protein AU499_11075 [Lonsdalea populi]RAT15474.1 hypothetical protein AU485_03600 [Lonsdalea quercina]RAT19886.1 hypothetical protein AU487_09545 [Lonsdalea populi]RAT24002.1 hypothetical protein AU489_10330 [Lonsdalea populi]RAT24546.1 hypothetical protein AU488_07495 [Lonsdalea populi]